MSYQTLPTFVRVAQREEALATGEMLVQIQPRALANLSKTTSVKCPVLLTFVAAFNIIASLKLEE
jgi:hypothetical protein